VRDEGSGNYKKHRQAFNFKEYGSAEEALAAASDWIGEMKKVVRTEKNGLIEIPLSIRPRLIYFVEQCKEKGYQLDEVFRLGIERLESLKLISEISFKDAAERTLAYKERNDKGKKYLSDLRYMFRAFGKKFDEIKLGEITAEDIEDWLDEREVSAVTWNNYRRMLGVLWSFAQHPRNAWVRENVIEHVAQKDVKTEEVTALTPAQAKTILASAQRDIPRLIPYLCVSMFAGLRRSEAQLAKWEDIDWATRSIRVQGGKMRGVTNRYVELEPVFIDWMKPIAEEQGDLCTGLFARREDLKKLRALTFDFDGNIFRHTYGSCHYHGFKNPQKTIVEMGHTSVTMLHKHYRRPIPQEIAAKYWALTREVVLTGENQPIGS
jgi:integrase